MITKNHQTNPQSGKLGRIIKTTLLWIVVILALIPVSKFMCRIETWSYDYRRQQEETLGIGYRWPEDFLARTNSYRADKGKVPLEMADILVRTAQEKADIIMKTGVFSHKIPGNPDYSDIMWRAGVPVSSNQQVGENLVCGWRGEGPAEMMALWMKSPTHRDNLLLDNYRYVGFGFGTTTLGATPCVLVVAHYATEI